MCSSHIRGTVNVFLFAGIAQLLRASDFHSEDRGLEPRYPLYIDRRGVAVKSQMVRIHHLSIICSVSVVGGAYLLAMQKAYAGSIPVHCSPPSKGLRR